MTFIRKNLLLILFFLFILGFSLADILTPDRIFSDTENRYLAQNPKFTLSSLMDNSFGLKYEEYINDQFVGRDNWIDIKSYTEFALAKIENNGITYGKDHYLFEKYQKVDEAKLENNIRYLQEYLAMYNYPKATLAIIPNSYMILNDKVPAGLNNVDQFTYIASIYEKMQENNLTTLDFKTVLQEHKNEYIYYRTDHHWTTYGAYLAYREYALSKGLTPVEYTALEGHDVLDFYGTYYSKTKNFNAVPDVITYFDVPVDSVEIDGSPVDGIYDLKKFEERDKYAAFLRGNNGLTVIRSGQNHNHQDGKTSRVMVIKDSYGNSFVPYLTYNYDEVYVVDLRALPNTMKLLMETDFDDILILYNFMNFTNDVNIAKLRY